MHLFHAPGAIIGHRQDGRPIRLIAGGSHPLPPADTTPPGQNDGQAGTTPPAPPAPPANQPPPADPAQGGDGTDWKAMARQWEKRAKDNSNAAAELAKLKASMMSDQEKAVAAAKAEGEAEAAKGFGRKLAAVAFKAAIAEAGLKLADVLDLIDTTQFVDDKGEVDEAAIKKAVAKLAKALPSAPAAAGADFQGSGGAGAPANLDQQIAEAEKNRNFTLAIQLKRQKAALQTTT